MAGSGYCSWAQWSRTQRVSESWRDRELDRLSCNNRRDAPPSWTGRPGPSTCLRRLQALRAPALTHAFGSLRAFDQRRGRLEIGGIEERNRSGSGQLSSVSPPSPCHPALCSWGRKM